MSRYRSYASVSGPSCPEARFHTPMPSGYGAWHDWAARMNRTHRQVRCPGCGLWKIWTLRVEMVRRCPYCLAAPGDPCVSMQKPGRTPPVLVKEPHIERKR